MANQFYPSGDNNQNGNKFKTEVSTNSVSFFGPNSMLLTKYGERNLTVSFRDAVYGEDGKRTFPRPSDGDEKNSCYLTKESVASFINKMDEYWIPTFGEYINNWIADPSFNKEVSFAIPVNKELNKLLEISSGIPGKSGYSPVLRLHFDVGSNRIPRESKIYTFISAPVFINYRPETGDYERLDITYPQLLIFYKVLTEYIRAICMGSAHSVEMRYHNEKKTVKDRINQIAVKNGIDIQSNYSSNGNGYGNPQPTLALPGTTSSMPNPTQTYDGDIGDLLGASSLPF